MLEDTRQCCGFVFQIVTTKKNKSPIGDDANTSQLLSKLSVVSSPEVRRQF
jgi:hypothetical protein